jgi:UvrD-like helicase C-terminal domain
MSGYSTAVQENSALVEQIRGWLAEGLRAGEIAVFVRERQLVPDLVRVLVHAGLPAAEVGAREDRSDRDVVRVMTMHRAKGLEFRAIAMPRMGAAEFPYGSPASRSRFGPEALTKRFWKGVSPRGGGDTLTACRPPAPVTS